MSSTTPRGVTIAGGGHPPLGGSPRGHPLSPTETNVKKSFFSFCSFYVSQKRAQRAEGDSIYIRHSLLMLEVGIWTSGRPTLRCPALCVHAVALPVVTPSHFLFWTGSPRSWPAGHTEELKHYDSFPLLTPPSSYDHFLPGGLPPAPLRGTNLNKPDADDLWKVIYII